jgi:hypothetical protein
MKVPTGCVSRTRTGRDSADSGQPGSPSLRATTRRRCTAGRVSWVSQCAVRETLTQAMRAGGKRAQPRMRDARMGDCEVIRARLRAGVNYSGRGGSRRMAASIE